MTFEEKMQAFTRSSTFIYIVIIVLILLLTLFILAGICGIDMACANGNEAFNYKG